MSGFTESIVEDAALAWLQALGYTVLHGPDIAAGESGAERSDPNYRDVLLEQRLRQALVRLNPELPPEAIEDAWRKLTRVDAPSLVEKNRAVQRLLVDGVRGTWPSNCSRSCSRARSGCGPGTTSWRRVPSRRCWSRPCGSTRTAPSKQLRSSRS